MITQQQYVAMTRFGLGPSFKDIEAMGNAPADWLQRQITPGVTDTGPDIPASSQSLIDYKANFNAIRKLKREGSGSGGINKSTEQQIKQLRQQSRTIVEAQLVQRFQYALTTDTPFRERLLQFYSNHFTVSRKGKNSIATACIGFENEAIRANLDGHFGEMLRAVVMHPVMLTYLDNTRSTGPNSTAGQKRNIGLNENLAREILELHTLGVDGGYRQHDVLALANIITGWTVGNTRMIKRGADPGEFFYAQRMHEPGTQELMGVAYTGSGVEQGQRALQDLSLHPSAARFLATKLACHFIADDPPAEAISLLTQTYIESKGHLPTLHRALIELDAVWNPIYRKFKAPYDYVLSVTRVLQPTLDKRWTRSIRTALVSMDQVPFSAISPAGWPDISRYWASPDALKKRIEWGLVVGNSSGATPVLAQQASNLLLSPDADKLRLTLSRAESPAQAMALLFASPDFQWR